VELVLQTKLGKLYKGDSFNLDKLNLKDVSLILTDPPYLIDYESWRPTKRQGKIKGDKLTVENLYKLYSIYRKASQTMERGYLFSFCSWKTLCVWMDIISAYFKIKNSIIWVKNNWTMGDLNHQLAQQYEIILMAVKGKPKKILRPRPTDVWNFKRAGSDRIHPTQKPEDLIRHIIEMTTDEGDLVLDMFAGSGVVGLTCEKLNRRWVMVELENKYIKSIIEEVEKWKR